MYWLIKAMIVFRLLQIRRPFVKEKLPKQKERRPGSGEPGSLQKDGSGSISECEQAWPLHSVVVGVGFFPIVAFQEVGFR